MKLFKKIGTAVAILLSVCGKCYAGGTSNVAPGAACSRLATLNASNSTSLSYTNLSASFTRYRFIFRAVKPATDNVTLNLNFSSNGGSSYLTDANYNYGGNYEANNINAGGTGQAVTAIPINFPGSSGVANNYSGGLSGEMDLFNAASSTTWPSLRMSLVWLRTGKDFWYFATGGGSYSPSTVVSVNAVRFMYSSGSITSGAIDVYGCP